METILHRNPDMLLETLLLLYIEPNEVQIASLLRAFFGGDVCRESWADIHGRYIAAFRAQKKVSAQWQTLVQTAVGEYLILLLTSLQLEDFLFKARTYSDEALLPHINGSFVFARDTGMPFIDFGNAETVTEYTQTQNCSAAFKAIVQEPSKYLVLLCDTVRDNLSAAEMAWDSVRAEVRAFTDLYWNEDYFFSHSVLTDGNVREVCPMLAVPFSAFILGDVCYCGIYNIDTDDARREGQKAFLLDCLKALSDPKRLEIAILLAQAPRYNRELAQLTDLTPATVMHHTDKLLQCGLVSIAAGQENQKKIYFKIESEKIELLKKAIGDLLE